MTVDILLATYQGARFLPELLTSLEAQTYVDWRLLARDDGSSDATVAIIAEFQRRHGDRVVIMPKGSGGGASANFGELLIASKAPYVMLCDQDDVWDSDKIEVSLKAIRSHEDRVSEEHPCLVHTDLRVADADLKVLAPSFWRYAKLFPEGKITLSSLLVQNVVTGCAVICNRALVEKALPVPPAAIMHDWWLALVAVAFGTLAPLPRATITYRQHGANAIGAQQFGTWRHLCRAAQQLRRLSKEKEEQARAFLERYEGILTEEQREVVRVYLKLPRCNFFTSRYLSIRYGFFKQGWQRRLAAFVLLKQP